MDVCRHLLAERERIVRAEHHAARAKGVDKQSEGAAVKHRRVDAEAIEIVRRWVKRLSARDLTLVPRVFQPAEEEGEGTAAVRKAKAKVGRQAVEGATKNHRGDRQMRLHWHADRPACTTGVVGSDGRG